MDDTPRNTSAPDVQEAPRYKCHKEVYAFRIANIEPINSGPNEESDGSKYLFPEEPGYPPIRVSADWMLKHDPRIGGYYVIYKDGYKSYSPQQAFEEGYTRVN